MLQRALQKYFNNFKGFSREIWILALITFINRAGTMVLPFLSKYLINLKMPKKVAKKKSTKKKEKKEKDPDEEDENKCPIEIQEYRDPDIYTPKTTLKIALVKPISTKMSKLNFIH